MCDYPNTRCFNGLNSSRVAFIPKELERPKEKLVVVFFISTRNSSEANIEASQ